MSTTRGERSSGGGLGLAARFALSMTVALSVVMALAGFFLFSSTRTIVDEAVYQTRRDATRLLAEGEVERAKDPSARLYEQTNDMAALTEDNHLKRFEVQITQGSHKAAHAYLYRWDERGNLLSPIKDEDSTSKLLGLFLGVSAAIILVGAGVSVMVATKVTKPIDGLINDVRAIGRGNLLHRSGVNASGEVGHLARQIDRMAGALEEAQDAEIELGMREREREVAVEVQEALLPQAAPSIPGYQLASKQRGAAEPGGDFHDMFEANGRIVLMVCDVSGAGVPGALVGATARAYLRTELARTDDGLEDALKKVNRQIAHDVRRGMYVTALCAVLDPEDNTAILACAGHKVPLIRWEAAEGNVRLVQPEGIALGFDEGPIFDRSLELLKVPIEPGDRLVLSNTGPPAVQNPDGAEVGEKAFYRAVARNAEHPPEVMLKRLLAGLEKYADGEPFPKDISIVTLARDA
ncbi:MAG: SpoIIE family protein phosphatase [bacterium]|nr:SpoIIE family protein phosphatase [bacterium]